jgi:hypothetical protein
MLPMEEEVGSRIAVTGRWLPAVLLLSACLVWADVSEEADLREAIVLACHYEMGEFGVSAVQNCIESETTALTALSAYPDPAKPIVTRCTRDMQHHGWAMVKACVDQDLAAEEALKHYSSEHQTLVASCRTQLAKQGSAKVKACVDRQASAPAGESKR